jgi:hypothetical protein
MSYLDLRSISESYSNFLIDLMKDSTHALTVTLRRDSGNKYDYNQRARLEETLRYSLRFIARATFKKRHRRENAQIGSVCVIETGAFQNRMHAHLALACPKFEPHPRFEINVRRSVARCRSLGKEIELKPIYDTAGWACYLSKQGLEALSHLCTQPAIH